MGVSRRDVPGTAARQGPDRYLAGVIRRRRIAWLAAVILVLAVAGVYTVARSLRQPAALALARDSLQTLRAAADSCHAALEEGQAGLHEYSAFLDSTRARVLELESHDSRGVPADSYGIYMRIFEQYTDSAAAWAERVEFLQADHERCRVVTEAHNVMADSVRRLLLEQRR